MAKCLALLTAAIMSMSLLASCGDKHTVTDTKASTAETTAAEQSNPAIDLGEMHSYTAEELIAQMGTGWNLGNSFDSLGGDETAWGNPVTTKEMIDAVKEQGFDILRIPVTWAEHMGGAPDYAIDETFLGRVQEVVDYGIEDGMFVIINTHHEPDSWLVPKSENMSAIEPQFAALWKQVAERFKDYGDKLVFEGINEARVKNTPEEWNGGTEDGRNCVNKLNRLFVDTVRATGGNNAERLLLIAPYGHCSNRTAMSALETDYDKFTAASVHAYTPYGFTYHPQTNYETFVWDGHENGSIDSLFNDIYDCVISRGMPVIITEYGAVKKPLEDGSPNTEEVCKWAEYYLGTAQKLGIPCVWWDNNACMGSGELFGLYNRKLNKWYRPEVADAVTGMYKDKKGSGTRE